MRLYLHLNGGRNAAPGARILAEHPVENMIDISELNKADVLAALYNRAQPQGAGFLYYKPQNMSPADAQLILDTGRTNFYNLFGRMMKVDLSGDAFDPWSYNRDNGSGAAESVIAVLRESRSVLSEDLEFLLCKC